MRDTVHAMQLVAAGGEPGEACNLGHGSPVRIQEVLDQLLALSTARLEVVSARERMRPSDEPILYPDTTKVQKLGWESQFSLKQTLADILEF